jgi:thiol-disulfide isomerase/thioredoxin
VGGVTTRSARVRAPELAGRGGWIGTDGPLSLAGLRGRFVLLDFWTFCCVNCLHVLEELRPLEERFADVLTVVGVHSPKFVHEADHDAVVAAVERYGVHHPVLDDPDLSTWKQYAVRAWPTLVLVDPEGYVVHVASGEGHAEGLGRLLAELVAEHDAKGTLRRGSGAWVTPAPST